MEIPWDLVYDGECVFTYIDSNIKTKNTRKHRMCKTFPANCFLTADSRRERTPSEITSCLFNKIALDSVKSKITSSFYCNIIDPTKRYVFLFFSSQGQLNKFHNLKNEKASKLLRLRSSYTIYVDLTFEIL